MISAYLLRVFTDNNGKFGDLASVVIDEGKHIPDLKRQMLARKLNTGETIFVNDITSSQISVMHPQGEIDFAGVGVLASAWLLDKLQNKPLTVLHGRSGEIKTWQENEITWVRTDISTLPHWHLKQLQSADEVERISKKETAKMEHTLLWSWIDEQKGLIRARTFASDWDIPEAEGNGSGAMLLATLLQRPLEIIHGKGSVIFAKPQSHNSASLGGSIIEDTQISLNET